MEEGKGRADEKLDQLDDNILNGGDALDGLDFGFRTEEVYMVCV